MSFLDNLKISYKISAVLVLFGAITAFIVVYGGLSMGQVDENYDVLTTKLAPARVEIARANRELNAIGYALRKHFQRRRDWPRELAAYPVIRLRTPAEVDRFLAGAGGP